MKRNILLFAVYITCQPLVAQTVQLVETAKLDSIPTITQHNSVSTVTDTLGSVAVYSPVAEFIAVTPNPANEEVRFLWLQKVELEVTLRVVDVQGSIAITLPLGKKDAGEYAKPFATAALTAGTYVASLQMGNEVFVQQFIVMH